MNKIDLMDLGEIKMESNGKHTPWHAIQAQIGFLDRALATIDGGFLEESNLARTFIVAQIEALKWAAKIVEKE